MTAPAPEAVEVVALAIHEARFAHPEHPRKAPPWVVRVADRKTVEFDSARAAIRAEATAAAEARAEGWQPIATAPKDGFFLAWSPDSPEIPMVVRASIFHSGRRPGTPKHLSFNHFTHWRPLPPIPAGNDT